MRFLFALPVAFAAVALSGVALADDNAASPAAAAASAGVVTAAASAAAAPKQRCHREYRVGSAMPVSVCDSDTAEGDRQQMINDMATRARMDGARAARAPGGGG